MKQLTTIIVILLMVLPLSAWAENTHSIDLEASSSQYLSISHYNQTGLDITGDITLEAWIKLEQLPSTAGNNFTIVAKDDVINRSYALRILTSNNKLILDWFSNRSLNRWSMNEVFDSDDIGVWIHIAAVLNISTRLITFYKDGASYTGTYDINNSGASIDYDTAPFTVGGRGDGASYFNGKIDEIRIWNNTRNAQEISENYNSELNGNEFGLVAYWELDNDLIDQINGNTLINNNSASFSTDVPFDGSSEPDPDPDPESCTITGDPINTNSVENLEGTGTNQLLTLGVNSSGEPVVCVSNVSDGSHLKTCEYGLNSTDTATSVFYISTTNEITITYYNANGDKYLLKYDYDTDTLGTPVELP